MAPVGGRFESDAPAESDVDERRSRWFDAEIVTRQNYTVLVDATAIAAGRADRDE